MEKRQKQLLKLLDDNGGKLHGLLYRLTLRYDIAEDLMQEMFIKLFKFKGLDDIDNIDFYARRVAINLAFDWRRRQKNKFVSLDQVSEASSKADGPMKRAVRGEQAEKLLSAVSKLKGAFREVVVLRYLEDMSDLFQRIAVAVAESVTQLDDFSFTVGQRFQKGFEPFA